MLNNSINSSINSSINDYPLIDDDNFYWEIYVRKEFYECRYKSEWWKEWNEINRSFKHLPHQRFVYNYMSPCTPYMGIFLFHGCGSGKSECASMIVESNKLFLDEHKKSAIFLVPNEMVLSSILSDLIGKEVMPDGSIRFKKKGTGDRYVNTDIRKLLNEINTHIHGAECEKNCEENLQRKIKRIIKYIKKERLLQYYDLNTHQRFAKYVDEMPIVEITKNLSNSIIIVDEIHKIRNQTRLYGALKKIATHTYNTKMVFMSGTPRVDREYELIPIINLLRMNDKHLNPSELLTETCLKQIFNKNPLIEKKAEAEFASKIKGYCSYIRGTNPITFPIRKEIGTRMIPNIHFNTVECFLKGKQLIVYLNAFFDEFNPNLEANITNELWEKTRCASRCAFENTKNEDWLYKNVGNISCKFEKMWEMFQLSEGKGAILIYAFNIDKGINLVERFLLANGVQPLTIENTSQKCPKFINFSNAKTSAEIRQRALDICKSHENYRGEYIKFILGTGKIRTGLTFRHLSQVHIVEPDWNIPTTEQTFFRGSRQFSHYHPEIADSNRDILTFRYRSTLCDKSLDQMPPMMKQKYSTFLEKYSSQLQKRGFLFTKKHINSTKINSFNHNEPKYENEPTTKKQKTIENSIENTVENTVEESVKNPVEESVKNPVEESVKNPVEKLNQKHLMTIDDYMYVTCLRKDVPGSKIDRLGKIYALDCALQIHANYFPTIEDSSFDYSRVAHYDKMDYPIAIPSANSLSYVSDIIARPEHISINTTTYDLRDWVLLVPDTGNNIEYVDSYLFDAVLGLFNIRNAWRFTEIIATLQQKDFISVKIIPFILDWLLSTKYRFFNSNNDEGYLIYAADVYIWNPIEKINGENTQDKNTQDKNNNRTIHDEKTQDRTNNRTIHDEQINEKNINGKNILTKKYETSVCNLFDIIDISENNLEHNFQTKYLSVQSFLNYDDAFKDIFDDVVPLNNKNNEQLYICSLHMKNNDKIYSINQQLIIEIINTEKICAVIDNTKDNPNDFNMKLWYGTANKIAASSRKLGELKKLCETLDIPLTSQHRKNDVYELLRDKLIETNRMLPWAPNKAPSLYRLFFVTQIWNILDAHTMILDIVNDIVNNKGYLFIKPVIRILQTKSTCISFEHLCKQLENFFIKRATNCPQFTLALIERMYGARPTRLTSNDWTIITEIYNEDFYQKYKDKIAHIFDIIFDFFKIMK